VDGTGRKGTRLPGRWDTRAPAQPSGRRDAGLSGPGHITCGWEEDKTSRVVGRTEEDRVASMGAVDRVLG
jgi:hypothetical protein